jgi:hypothetical protein
VRHDRFGGKGALIPSAHQPVRARRDTQVAFFMAN